MRHETDLSLAVGDWTRINANRGRHLSDRHRHEFEEECERLAAAIPPRAVRERLEPAKKLVSEIFIWRGRGWIALPDESRDAIIAAELKEHLSRGEKVRRANRHRLRRGPTLPCQAKELDIFWLVTTRTNTRQLLGGMMQLVA